MLPTNKPQMNNNINDETILNQIIRIIHDQFSDKILIFRLLAIPARYNEGINEVGVEKLSNRTRLKKKIRKIP